MHILFQGSQWLNNKMVEVEIICDINHFSSRYVFTDNKEKENKSCRIMVNKRSYFLTDEQYNRIIWAIDSANPDTILIKALPEDQLAIKYATHKYKS